MARVLARYTTEPGYQHMRSEWADGDRLQPVDGEHVIADAAH